jgi:hypothetical protein
VTDQDILRTLNVFRGVGRFLARHALAPTLSIGGDCFEDQNVAFGLNAERRLERRN